MSYTVTERLVLVGASVRLGLLVGPGDEWLGIGRVEIGGVALRDARHPLVVRLATPEGIVYTRLEVKSVRQGRAGAEVKLQAVGQDSGRQEYRDEYEQVMVTPGASRASVADELTLRVKPVTEVIGGGKMQGFEWSWRFHSAKRSIHNLLVDGSWELGGRLTGNTVLQQGQCNMPVYRGAKGTVFTTTCLKTLEQHDSPQGVSYQLAPRGGLIQAFDFQHGKAGALLHYWPRVGSISSVIESPEEIGRAHV
jgi:hypothetical protein